MNALCSRSADAGAPGRPHSTGGGRRNRDGRDSSPNALDRAERVPVPVLVFMPMESFEGDLDSSVLYCGESCSLITDVKPAADIVRILAADAEATRKNAAE